MRLQYVKVVLYKSCGKPFYETESKISWNRYKIFVQRCWWNWMACLSLLKMIQCNKVLPTAIFQFIWITTIRSPLYFIVQLLGARTTVTKSLNCFATQLQILIPNKYFGCGCKSLVFCRNIGWIMENMDKGLTVPKWVLIVRHPKFPRIYLPNH